MLQNNMSLFYNYYIKYIYIYIYIYIILWEIPTTVYFKISIDLGIICINK